jgi:hypothetical protein
VFLLVASLVHVLLGDGRWALAGASPASSSARRPAQA